MVAMAITTIIVTVLVTITSLSLETWNRSRSELRASRQAKAGLDTLSRDLEALVTRRGNSNEWLSATVSDQAIGDKIKSSNASEVVFFTAATDRYNGKIGNATADKGGDVSCVGYSLEYRDPITAGTGASNFKTFVLNRYLVNPDETYEKLLGQTDSTNSGKTLKTVFDTGFSAELSKPANFICENIYQFSLVFNVQVNQSTGTGPVTVLNVPVVVEPSKNKSFRILGTGIETTAPAGSGVTAEELASGRITSVEISVTVISDFGIDQMRTRTFTSSQLADFLSKNSYQFTKLVQIPSM
jgi:hypothetical protein